MRLTLSMSVGVSIGRSERRSITSASMPSASRPAAASSARCTMIEVATMVTSRPGRRMAARPIGTV